MALAIADGSDIFVEFSLLTASSVLFDAVYVPGGAASIAALAAERDTLEFLSDAFRHCKTIGATGDGIDLLRAAIPGLSLDGLEGDNGNPPIEGIVTAPESGGAFLREFLAGVTTRHWTRVGKNSTAPPPDGEETRGRQAASTMPA